MSYPKRICIIPSYLSVLKLQNYSSQCNRCAFFRKIEEKLFWVIEAINEASAINSIMNLSGTFYVIADAKSLCPILYSSGNIQIKRCGGPMDPPPLPPSYIKLGKTSLSRELMILLKCKNCFIFSNRLLAIISAI